MRIRVSRSLLAWGRVAFGLAVLGLAAFAGWARRRPEVPPFVPPPPPVAETLGAAPQPRFAGLLGINEGFAVRGAVGSAGARGDLVRRGALLREVGANAVRLNSHSFPHLNFHAFRGFADSDLVVEAAQTAGLDLLVVLGPWPGSRTASYTVRYLPRDLFAYTAWVGTVVERYDGDGQGDMPGLTRPIKAWEVDNEPDLHHRVRARGDDDGGLVFDDAPAPAAGEFEPPEEYAAVLLATSAAIRAADPEATIVSGGMYEPARPAGRAYLAEVLATPGVLGTGDERGAIDAIGVHCYFSENALEPVDETLATVRALAPDLPIWVTETSVPSEGRRPWIDEAWQARMLVGTVGALVAGGVDHVFWHSLLDAPNAAEEPGGFRTNSLFRIVADGEATSFLRKPSGDAFVELAGLLGSTRAAELHEVRDDAGRMLEGPNGWLVFDGSVATPTGASSVRSLPAGEPVRPGPTVDAPAWIDRP